jgi:hypothetical protein
MKKMMKEDESEIPAIIKNSPDAVVFFNDTISFIWPRVVSQLVNNSINEVKDNFELEKNRKSLLEVQVNIGSLQPRSVVRAEIKQVQPNILFKIEKYSVLTMDSKSLSALPENPQEKLLSNYVNGQYFAKNQDLDLNQLCKQNKGKIGIDLGDAPKMIVNTGSIRGAWDISTRIYVGRMFALKASITENCQDIAFKVPQKIYFGLNSELDNFKNNVISSDNEILLSNHILKKLLVMPGKYRMTTSSLVTGAIISTHEFNIDPGTNTVVNAKTE